MNHAAEIARLAAEHRGRATQLLADVEEQHRRHGEVERRIGRREPEREATELLDETPDDSDDPMYRPRSWLV